MPRRGSKRSKAAAPIQVTDSAAKQAYLRIKEEILSNRLAAGEPVQIERFVRDLRLSRTPVREAILRLASEGLIEVRPRMGTFVSHLDLRQIREMYEVRQALEALAARLAARQAPAGRLAALEERLLSMALETPKDYRALSEAGQDVHRLIAETSGNAVLTGMIASLQDHFTRFRSLSLALPQKVLASHQEHIEIVRALRAGDPDAAQEAVHRHFEHAAQSLLQSLLERPDPGRQRPRITLGAGR